MVNKPYIPQTQPGHGYQPYFKHWETIIIPWDFGEIPLGYSATASRPCWNLTMDTENERNITLHLHSTDPAHFTITQDWLHLPIEWPYGDYYEVTFTPMEQGQYSAEIVIDCTFTGCTPTIVHIPVSGNGI